MDIDQLRRLLSQNEGLKLDFKREYQLQRTPPSNTDRQSWKDMMEGQWHELIKDVIALANGNVGVPEQTGYLIIGAEDNLQPDGTRKLFDASHLGISTQQIIHKVNSFCEPPLPEITCDAIAIDGRVIYVISIPPTPYVHETNKPLIIKKGDFDQTGNLVNVRTTKEFTEYTAFIRKGENVYPASANERKALEADKRFDLLVMEENLRFELITNIKTLLTKSGSTELYSPAFLYRLFKDKYPLSIDHDLMVPVKYVKWLIMAIVFIGSAKDMSTRFIEQAINSGRYLVYNPRTGKHERSEFLHFLYELYINIQRFVSAADQPQNNQFMGSYNLKGLSDDNKVRVDRFQILVVAAMFERFEDVLQLSSALLDYLLGDKTSLQTIRLNLRSPLHDQNKGIEEEKATEAGVLEWVRSKRYQREQ